VSPVVFDGSVAGYIVGDLPIGDEMILKLQADTGVRAGSAAAVVDKSKTSVANITRIAKGDERGGWTTLFTKNVIFLDYHEWDTGETKRASISLSYKPSELYRRLSDAQSFNLLDSKVSFGVAAILALLAVAVLLLTILMVAYFLGLELATSI